MAWTASNSGGSSISEYIVEVRGGDSPLEGTDMKFGQWRKFECNSDDLLRCKIDVNKLSLAPYLLKPSLPFEARVFAINSNGKSVASDLVEIEKLPTTPLIPVVISVSD